MKAKSFTISISLPVVPETVFGALTDSKQIARWSGQKGKVESIIGGNIELFDRWVKGTVLAYEPGKQLSFTWKPKEWAKEDQASVVVCRLTKTKTGSKLTLKHSGFPNDTELQEHKVGWSQFVFEPLKTYLLNH